MFLSAKKKVTLLNTSFFNDLVNDSPYKYAHELLQDSCRGDADSLFLAPSSHFSFFFHCDLLFTMTFKIAMQYFGFFNATVLSISLTPLPSWFLKGI